jgi:hypothetical protein
MRNYNELKTIKHRIRKLKSKLRQKATPIDELEKIDYMLWRVKTQPYPKDWFKVYLEIVKLEVMFLEVLSLWLKLSDKQQAKQDKREVKITNTA